MKKTEYLKRIGFHNIKMEANLENLKLLQKQHLMHIPFENLDIHWNTPIVLDVQKFYKKIVTNKRGGFCYELNGLFNELLKEIGYKTKIVSARVSMGKVGFGEEYDHLAILVDIDGEEYLTDVGFGDFTIEPLKLQINFEQIGLTGAYLIRKYDDEYFEVVKKRNKEWDSEYIFKDIERNLKEFENMCKFHQSTKSHFSKGKICSRLTKNGRKTLTDKKFITNQNIEKYNLEIKSEDEFTRILGKEFNIKK